MIIGNNNDANNNNFFNKNISFENKKFQGNKPIQNNQENNFLTEDLSTLNHTDPTNNKEMYNKTLAMLQERLKNKTISLEEFNKKCSQLSKNRQTDEK